MKQIIVCSSLFVLLFACSHAIQSEDQVFKRHVDIFTADELVIDVVYKWYMDSLGCLDLRDIKDCVFLAELFNLKGSTVERVLDVLGQPTKIEEDFDWVDNEEYRKWNCTVFSYFCWSACKDG